MSGHKNKKVLLTAVLIFVLAASLALGGFGVYALRTLNNLEMVMTNDYSVAVEEGSTIVRVGTAIFGARDYQ